MYSLNDVDLFHVSVADVAAVEDVGFPVEGTPERVAKPARANLGPAGYGRTIKQVRKISTEGVGGREGGREPSIKGKH